MSSVPIRCGAVLAAMLAIGVSLLLLIPAGSGAGAPEARGFGEETVVLAVWATIDGDTPVSGGRVRVLGSGGSALEQVSPTVETTGPQGTALLGFSDLPSAFTVVVSGGKVRGKRLAGALRADVRKYRPAGVVHVSPVTTMIAQDIRARHRREEKATVGAARRGIERLLRIPPYLDATDLRRSDEFFDGDTFLERAGGGPGVPRLIDELVRAELRPGDPARRFVPPGLKPRSPADRRALAVQARPVISGEQLKKALTALSKTAVGKLSDYLMLPEGVKNTLIGWVLKGWGEAEELEDPHMAEIRDFLGRIDGQLAELKNDVAQVKLEVLAGQTAETLGKIKTAAEGLSALSTKLSGDPLKPERARLLRDFIENNLLAAPESLHNWLVGGVPLTDGILKSASQAASKRKRFFDASDSASVKSVYDYYALYQVQLATLLTNYMHAKPEAWSGQDIQTQVAKIEANIDQQEKLLKPTVPDGAVVDMNTNKMWTQNYSPNNLPASEFFRRVKPQGVGPLKTEWPQGTHGPRGIQGLPFGNWTLPSQAEIETLIQGRGGKAGVVWLKEEAGMSQNQASGGGGWAFMSKPTGWKAHIQGTRSLADDSLEIFRYDLWRGIVVSKEIRWCGDANARCVEELRGKLGEIKGATMYVRPLGNDERYWWR